jgi:ring-1,2-phenylacetyl-CoA epoxidase subunit PaaE
MNYFIFAPQYYINMSKFYSLAISEITQETADCVSIAFHIPSDLKDIFSYKQGQYITFKLLVNGEDLRRSYSVCSSPVLNEDLRIAVKKVVGGKGSIFLNTNYKVGDSIEVMPPMGNFHSEMKSSNKKSYILFGGGSGITPMLSIIKTVLVSEPDSKTILLYGNLNESATIFKQQLSDLETANPDKLKVIHVLEKPENSNHPAELTGIMKPEMVEMLINKYTTFGDNEYFICGPTPMMQSVEGTLQKLFVPKHQVHLEYFTAPVAAENTISVDSAVNCTATIILDGDTFTVNIAPGENVLDAAINAGLDAPYACQGGSCCTCRALLTEGKVEMKVNYALLDQEVKEGFVLTCQSIPQTQTITVNYDKGR